MTTPREIRARADELLRQALATEDPNLRGRMLTLAAEWHMRAVDAENPGKLVDGAEPPQLDELDAPDEPEAP